MGVEEFWFELFSLFVVLILGLLLNFTKLHVTLIMENKTTIGNLAHKHKAYTS
jgi:hypothetical protein